MSSDREDMSLVPATFVWVESERLCEVYATAAGRLVDHDTGLVAAALLGSRDTLFVDVSEMPEQAWLTLFGDSPPFEDFKHLFHLPGKRRLDSEDDRPFCLLLTQREIELADMVAAGHDNRKVAELLNLREQSVKNYVSVIMGKLEVDNRVQLALVVHGIASSKKVINPGSRLLV